MENRKLTKKELNEIALDPEQNEDLAHSRMWKVINNLVQAERDLWVAEYAYASCDTEKEKQVRLIKVMIANLCEELNYLAEL